MRHPDPEQLVLIALGETAPTDHLDGCDTCRAEVEQLRVVAAVGAETQDVRDLPAPPAAVWAGIEAATRGSTPADGPRLTRSALTDCRCFFVKAIAASTIGCSEVGRLSGAS